MTVSPDAWPHRAVDAEDVFPLPATARPEQDDPELDDPELDDPELDDPEQRDAGQIDPDPPDGWEPV